MERALIETYLINFAYVILRAVSYAFACVLAWWLFDHLATNVHFAKEISENKNIGAAIVFAAIFLGLAYVIGQM